MEIISDKVESFKELNEKPGELLNTEEYKYWETYLKDLESSNNELFKKLGYRKMNGEELSPEENKTYDMLLASIKDDAKRRLGESKYAYDIILRTMRSIEAMKGKAPIGVIAQELKQLLEAMLLFSYGICEKAYALNELPTATLEELMDHYYYGDDIYSGDSKIALECALEAERKGSKKCFYKIGLIYQLGTQDRAPDYEMAAMYYKKAIENQDYNGMDENEKILACEYLMNLYWDPTLLDDVDKAIMYRKQYVDLIGGSYE